MDFQIPCFPCAVATLEITESVVTDRSGKSQNAIARIPDNSNWFTRNWQYFVLSSIVSVQDIV